MTDWGPEPPYTQDELRGMDFIIGDWYWVLHPNPAFNGPMGILHFTTGRAAFAPDYIYTRGKAPWFQENEEEDVVQVDMLDKEGNNLLWMLAWCWAENGFTITPMNGGQAEYDELIPTESVLIDGEWGVPEELMGGGGESFAMETGEGAGESGEEEVTSDG